MWNENDFVFKSQNIDDIINFIKNYKGEDIPGLRNDLGKTFDLSKKNGKLEYSLKSGFTLFYDKKYDEFVVVIKDTYDPANLLSLLFDILVDQTDKNIETEIEYKHKMIDKYFGKISENEKMDFSEYINFFKETTSNMVKTIATFCDDEFSEDELERISNIIDETFYEPLSKKFDELISLFSSKSFKIDNIEV